VPTVVDLFAGAGGFSRGFEEAGFEVVAAVEANPAHAAAHRANFPAADLQQADIRSVAAIEARPDVLIGGPPCEAFTGANARRLPDPLARLEKDERGQLVQEYIRLLAQLRPRVFVMENVVGVAEGPLRGALRAAFRDAGFPKVWFNVLRAEEHGTASRRERMFLSNLPLAPKLRDPLDVAEAFAGLPEPGPEPPNHEAVPLTDAKRAKLMRLRPGESLVRYRSASGRGLANWMRLHADQVAPPVMGRSRFVHPTGARVLTVREQARLMGFPDQHVFAGGRDAQFDQVGEAVPPPLARAVAGDVRAYLSVLGSAGASRSA